MNCFVLCSPAKLMSKGWLKKQMSFGHTPTIKLETYSCIYLFKSLYLKSSQLSSENHFLRWQCSYKKMQQYRNVVTFGHFKSSYMALKVGPRPPGIRGCKPNASSPLSLVMCQQLFLLPRIEKEEGGMEQKKEHRQEESGWLEWLWCSIYPTTLFSPTLLLPLCPFFLFQFK